jgi:GTP cyclohydrolase II
VQTTGANRDIKGNMSQTKKECLGPSVLHDFKVPKEKVMLQKRTITLCGGPIQVVLTIVTGIKTIRQQES